MKQVKVKNLKGNEITALPIVTDSGTVLIHADVVLNSELINRIRNLGIQSLSIKEYPDEIIDPGEYGHIIIGTDDKLGEDDDIYSDNSNGTGIDNDNNYNKEIENVSEDGISNTDNNGGESDYYQDKSNNKNDSDNVNNDSHNAENLHDNELNKSDIDSNESNSKAKSHSGNSYYRHIYKVEETTNNSRKVVKNVLEKHIYKHNQDLKILGLEAERIIESVLSEPEVINNITEIRNLIKELGKTHTVILSSHILSEVSQICQKVIIINKGKIIAVDTPENLENKVASKNDIYVTVEDLDNRIEEVAKDIKEITKIELVKENKDKTKQYLIESEKDVDLRKILFKELAKENITIFEMKKADTTLEDAFMKLIEGGN